MNQNNSGFLNSIPVITRNIIIINLLVWFAQFLLLKNGIDLSDYLGLHFYKSEKFMPHQLFTYMFLHDPNGFSHVLFNMFAVYMFGRTIETVWGAKRFLFFYIICGLGAGIAQELTLVFDLREVVFNPDIQHINTGNAILTIQEFYNKIYPTVGASGSVFGILAGFGMMFPNTKLYIIPFPFPVKAKWVVIGYGALELILGGANLSGDNIAHFAHLGGLITGFILLLYWKKKGTMYGKFYQ